MLIDRKKFYDSIRESLFYGVLSQRLGVEKFPQQAPGGIVACGFGFFKSLEITEEDALAILLKSCIVSLLAALACIALADAFQADMAVLAASAVRLVLLVGSGPQVVPFVVGFVFVSMVYFKRRPRAGHVEEGQSSGKVSDAKYADAPITVFHPRTCFGSGLARSSANSPAPLARFRVIMQETAKRLSPQIVSKFHGALA
jgi:hypothetical protein